MSNLKIAAIGGVLAASLLSSSAFAQDPISLTWSNWSTTPITMTDKTFTLYDFDASVFIQSTPQNGSSLTSTNAFAGNPQVTIFVNENGDHQVNLTGPSGTSFVMGAPNSSIYAIQYIANIDTSTYPPDDDELRFGLTRLSLNATAPFGKFSVTKRIQGLTPHVDGGNQWVGNAAYDVGMFFDKSISTQDSTEASVFCGICTTFLVTDYVTILNSSQTTVLNQMTNTFEQELPVPAPLALVATGLLGVGLARRMKRS